MSRVVKRNCSRLVALDLFYQIQIRSLMKSFPLRVRFIAVLCEALVDLQFLLRVHKNAVFADKMV